MSLKRPFDDVEQAEDGENESDGKLRGIWAYEEEEDQQWKLAVLPFGPGVPKFRTKEDCAAFMRRCCGKSTNPDRPHMFHLISILASWKQIETVVLDRIKLMEEDERPPSSESLLKGNRFRNDAAICEMLERRMGLPHHKYLSRLSTLNTFRYLFHVMRCGIFVKILDGRVRMFAPFVNTEYSNSWGDGLKFSSSDGTLETYFEERERVARSVNYLKNPKRWWANGGVIGNELVSPGEDSPMYWGDHLLAQLRDMFDALCRERGVPNCEFFLNKRDVPQLKGDLTEPFDALFPEPPRPLSQHKYKTYAPIFSFYGSEGWVAVVVRAPDAFRRFSDLLLPTAVEWEIATGSVFPPSFKARHCPKCPCGSAVRCRNGWRCFCKAGRLSHLVPPRDSFTPEKIAALGSVSWDAKTPTALFRGAATGFGVTAESNQRLHLVDIAHRWNADSAERERFVPHGIPLVDAELTSWNLRDKVAGGVVSVLNPDAFDFDAGTHNFLPLEQQCGFKYIVYVQGHSASNRYAALMRMRCVILKVASTCPGSDMWFFPALEPFRDHVPVKADLSDLEEKIQWCRSHDEECQRIAEAALDLSQRLCCKESLLDYLQLALCRIADQTYAMPPWFRSLGAAVPPPRTTEHTASCDKGEVVCEGCKQRRQEQEAVAWEASIGAATQRQRRSNEAAEKPPSRKLKRPGVMRKRKHK